MDFNGMLQFSAALFAMSLIAPPKRIANERFFVASHLSYWNRAATFLLPFLMICHRFLACGNHQDPIYYKATAFFAQVRGKHMFIYDVFHFEFSTHVLLHHSMCPCVFCVQAPGNQHLFAFLMNSGHKRKRRRLQDLVSNAIARGVVQTARSQRKQIPHPPRSTSAFEEEEARGLFEEEDSD